MEVRHPNAEQLRQQCRDALPVVLRSLGLRADAAFELDTEGWVNVCFIGAEVVVRFNARDPKLPKFDREEWAMRVLHDRGFPVPRVLGRVDNPRLSPFPVIATQRIDGENLEATWEQLDAAQEERLASQAGRWLARLHQQPIGGFGEVFRPKHSSQRAFWGEQAMDFLVACTTLFDAGDLERFRHAIEASCAYLDDAIEARLVHRDYHFGNLLHDGRDIVGILDFEWAVASDPAIDRVQFGQLDEQCPGALEPFLAAYEAEAGPIDDDPIRAGLYRIAMNLELCDVAARFLSEEERDTYLATTLESLSALEARLGK